MKKERQVHPAAKDSIRGSILHSASLERGYGTTDSNSLFFFQARHTDSALSNNPTLFACVAQTLTGISFKDSSSSEEFNKMSFHKEK